MSKSKEFFVGFYQRLLEGRYDIEVVQEFFDILQDYRYCVIGGFAIGLYTKDYSRVSLGDIDIIISKSDVSDLIRDFTKAGFLFRKGMIEDYGVLIFSKNGYEFDVLIPEDDFIDDVIYDRVSFRYKGRSYYISPIWYLVYGKLKLGRDKDFSDIDKLILVMDDRDIDFVINKLRDIDDIMSEDFENLVYAVRYK